MTALLDVNVLVALAWPNHVHHPSARRWFRDHCDQGWATTPVTEGGFVRVSTNRSALPTNTTPEIAIDLLRALTLQGQHVFWPDDVRFVLGLDHRWAPRLRGHRQITDAHLLALAERHQGRLATFDQRLAELGSSQPDLVDLVEQ